VPALPPKKVSLLGKHKDVERNKAVLKPWFSLVLKSFHMLQPSIDFFDLYEILRLPKTFLSLLSLLSLLLTQDFSFGYISRSDDRPPELKNIEIPNVSDVPLLQTS